MKARDLMSSQPFVVTGDESVAVAARLMRDRNVGMVPVVDDRAHLHLRGLITDRDIVVRCVAERHPGACRVEDHMTTARLRTVTADAEVSEVVARMMEDQVRRILVTEGGRLIGVIAQADLALKAGPLEPLRVEEVLERISAPLPSAR
jgi:CBS domain-containing protein